MIFFSPRSPKKLNAYINRLFVPPLRRPSEVEEAARLPLRVPPARRAFREASSEPRLPGGGDGKGAAPASGTGTSRSPFPAFFWGAPFFGFSTSAGRRGPQQERKTVGKLGTRTFYWAAGFRRGAAGSDGGGEVKESCGRYSRCIAEKGSALQCISMGRQRKGKKSAEAAVSLGGSTSGLGGESEEASRGGSPAGGPRGEPPCPRARCWPSELGREREEVAPAAAFSHQPWLAG